MSTHFGEVGGGGGHPLLHHSAVALMARRVAAVLEATQADLAYAFCRTLSIAGCLLLLAVGRPRGGSPTVARVKKD